MSESVAEDEPHRSDSREQREAEKDAVRELGVRLGLTLAPARLSLGTSAKVNVDGFAEGPPPTLVEVFAHQGPLKGSQPHKVMSDAMKLVAVSRFRFGSQARLIVALTCTDADRSLAGWRREALRALGVDVELVPLSSAMVHRLRLAQERQRMTNASHAEPES